MQARQHCAAPLRRGGRNAYLYPNPQVNRHLRPFAEKYFAPEDFTAKYTVAVDVATEGMLPKGFEGAVDLCIDHHPTNSGYAGETLVRADKSSCAEAVMEVILCMNTDLTPDEATLLYRPHDGYRLLPVFQHQRRKLPRGSGAAAARRGQRNGQHGVLPQGVPCAAQAKA